MSGDERRKYERKRLGEKIIMDNLVAEIMSDIRLKKLSGEMLMNAIVLDISEQGVGISMRESLHAAQELITVMTININGSPAASADIAGLVRWVKIDDHGSFAAGIQFNKKINSIDFPVLMKCLKLANLST
ncbi:MAG: PilZ domain-containing protein [Deltaproteobacteria bacterium]